MSATNSATARVAEKLQAAGIRATTDAGALNPPAVLVVPPHRVYDVGCGYTAQWELTAIAPAPRGSGDHTVNDLLDEMVDAVAATFPVERAQRITYVVATNNYPAYLVTFTTTED